MQTAARRSFDYDMPLIQTPTSACQIRQAWAKVADTPDRETAGRLKDEIKALLKEKNAVLVAHYYVDPLIQDLALETGGCVGDSLEMARFGAEHEAGTLVVAGVRFMGESAKILCPEKTVLMPDLEAECSLDFGLSGRGVFSVLQPTPRPHSRSVRQHFRRRESACRLGGHVFGGVGNRVVFEIARREVDLGARPPPRRLHPPRNGRGYAVVAGFVYRP